MQVQGKIPRDAKVGKVAKGQYVELAREGEDSIFTIIGQFGNAVDTRFGGAPGPVHNQIPQPDRTVDNTTIWAPDFSQAYYKNLLFSEAPGRSSMRNFYIENSSGRYAVNGDVSDWVNVPYNEARYGSDYCGAIVCARHWLFVQDTANAWYRRPDGGRQDGRRSRPISRSSTSGIATTTTATATSTSRTTTSTTSRRSTPVRARRPAAAPRAPTPSGRTAGTRSTPTPGRPARRARSSAASRSATPATGSATTPSSRRTVASASSPTSSVTTSACRTCTTRRATPAVPRTGPASGRPGRAVPTGTTVTPTRGLAIARSRRVHGTSSNSAG